MAADELSRPRLRAVEILPAEGPQGQAYILRDPLGVAPGDTAVPPHGLLLMHFMDGTRTIAELIAEFQDQTGQTVTAEQVQSLVDQLDEKFLLESETFIAAMSLKVAEFKLSPYRDSILAGNDLPAEPDAALARLSSIIAAAGNSEATPTGNAVGLIVPHIDLQRGANGYGLGYGWLATQPCPARVLLLGTSHNGATQPLIPTDKDFRTPLGIATVDKTFVNRLRSCLSEESSQEEFIHQQEHSLEFQVLFLQQLAPAGPPPIVPILTGPLPTDSEGTPMVDDMVNDLQNIIADSPGQTLIIAGADLAHVGPDFGDEDMVGADQLKTLEQQDRESLELVSRGDANGFYRHISAGLNPRRICGLAPIYLLMRLLPGTRATLLDYTQARQEKGQQCVTHATMAMTRD